MNKYLQSLPTSVHDELASVQRLLGQNSSSFGQGNVQVAAFNAATELVKHDPGYAAALIAAMIGSRGFEVTEITKTTSYREVERTFLGFTVGQDLRPFTDTTIRTRRIRTY